MISKIGTNVKIKATQDITDQILKIIREELNEQESVMEIKNYDFNDLSLPCRDGKFLARNLKYAAKIIYPEKYKNVIFYRDIYSPHKQAETPLIYIYDFWERNGKFFYRFSENIQGKEKITIRGWNDKYYYKGKRVIIFGKKEEIMDVFVAGQINNTIFAYR